jgi:hypothetical protein
MFLNDYYPKLLIYVSFSKNAPFLKINWHSFLTNNPKDHADKCERKCRLHLGPRLVGEAMSPTNVSTVRFFVSKIRNESECKGVIKLDPVLRNMFDVKLIYNTWINQFVTIEYSFKVYTGWVGL